MRKQLIVVCALFVSACSTPLPCVFNDTAECEARWQPVMHRQTNPAIFYNAAQAATPPVLVAPPDQHQTICRPQSAGNDVWLACQ